MNTLIPHEIMHYIHSMLRVYEVARLQAEVGDWFQWISMPASDTNKRLASLSSKKYVYSLNRSILCLQYQVLPLLLIQV